MAYVVGGGGGANVYKVLVGRLLGRSRHIWEDNIKVGLNY